MSAAASLARAHEQTIKEVLSKLLKNPQHEALAWDWFQQRNAVHIRECQLVDDRYEQMGMEYREEQTKYDIQASFERLVTLAADPERRQIVAELCEWLRYQSMPPRVLHEYPSELKGACQAAHFDNIVELADAINAFF